MSWGLGPKGLRLGAWTLRGSLNLPRSQGCQDRALPVNLKALVSWSEKWVRGLEEGTMAWSEETALGTEGNWLQQGGSWIPD